VVKKAASRPSMHKILFCEPYVVRNRSYIKGGVKFDVSDKFYPTLLCAPRSLHVRRSTFDIGNAYVFGRRFPLDSYEHLGSCGNDGAQIGFIDLDNFDEEVSKNVSEIVLENYGLTKHQGPSAANSSRGITGRHSGASEKSCPISYSWGYRWWRCGRRHLCTPNRGKNRRDHHRQRVFLSFGPICMNATPRRRVHPMVPHFLRS
jgi:hypothetical protein